MMYTLAPLASCSTDVGLLFSIVTGTIFSMVVCSFLGKDYVYGVLFGGIIMFGYYYSESTPTPRENRVVIGTLVKTETVIATSSKYDSQPYIQATYEVEGGRQVVTTKDNYYPNKAVFYANKPIETCD